MKWDGDAAHAGILKEEPHDADECLAVPEIEFSAGGNEGREDFRIQFIIQDGEEHQSAVRKTGAGCFAAIVRSGCWWRGQNG